MVDTAEERLIEQARSGDAAALEELLERHQAQIYRFGLRICRDPEDAKDVLQDTLIAMARGIRGFRGGSSLSTWLYVIARSYCVKKHRRSKFAPSELTSLSTNSRCEAVRAPDPSQTPEDAFAARELATAFESAVRALEPTYREVLVLRDIEGLTAPEVARVLDVTTEAVKSRLHRARKAVRDHVSPLLGIPSAELGDGTASCPDILSVFSRHLEGEISADVCARMQQHVEVCIRCRNACDSLKQTLALCRATRSIEVPERVQHTVRAALREFLAAQNR